ncbi:MAG: SMP-30/gluconolactonase/LRE family protein [Chloroflexota bacterium]|nr:SMP-30/gluconolactonase/LRE family protein [Chloroflexota bacterium]
MNHALAPLSFHSHELTAPGGFTDGIEGPGCDRAGHLYTVNFERQGTIGRVTPQGECSLFLELPGGSCGNGIRFNRRGDMLIADYTNHNVLRVDMQICARATTLARRNAAITVYAHEPMMNQPNDLAIAANDLVFASDPNWQGSWGQIWRVDTAGKVTLLETNMGTTNGIEVDPDERTLYVNETVQRRIWAYDLSAVGEISCKRLLIQFSDFGMDGMRCDVAGNLYVTRWGKGTVVKLSPRGEVLAEIEVSGANCTNIAFGGPDGCTAYVTVADRGNVESFRVDQPGREWQLAQDNVPGTGEVISV